MTVTIIDDCRIRTRDYQVMIGDPCSRQNGQPGIVIAAKQVGNQWFILNVPTSSISDEWRSRMYAGDFLGKEVANGLP